MCTILRALTLAGSKNSFRKPNPLVDASPVIVALASNRATAVPVAVALAETEAPAFETATSFTSATVAVPALDTLGLVTFRTMTFATLDAVLTVPAASVTSVTVPEAVDELETAPVV